MIALQLQAVGGCGDGGEGRQVGFAQIQLPLDEFAQKCEAVQIGGLTGPYGGSLAAATCKYCL